MAFVLIGIDSDHDTVIEEKCSNVLRTYGFSIDIRRQLLQLPHTIETVAKAGGKIDVIVLILNYEYASLVPDPFQIVHTIRKLPDSLAFIGAVRAKTIPIIAITNFFAFYFNKDNDIKWFKDLSRKTLDDNPDILIKEIITLINGWRQSLIEDLDYAGYAVTLGSSGELDISHALIRRKREAEILTDQATPGSLRCGQYLILAQDLLQQFTPYVKLKSLLNNYRDIANKEGIKPESVFQRFFEEHPHLVLRDLFDKHWAQPSLRIPFSDESLRPDFVLRPRVAADFGSKWQILDLKLPDDPLLVSPKFHSGFSMKVTRAIQQLQNYKYYFNRPDTEEELIKKFGVRPLSPRLAVLIGRRDRVADVMTLDNMQGRYLDVEILTYDEIVDFEAQRLALHSALARVF